MMKRILMIVMAVAMATVAVAQTDVPLSDKQSQEVMAQLTEAAMGMKTMQCRFVQSKVSTMLAEPSVAEGTMHFASPDKMRWEYIMPYAFALVVNGDRIVKVTDGKAEVLDGKSGRMYQGMVGIIMGSASGKKLFDTSVFDVVLYDEDACWTPKRRDMKRMFSQLVFRFDKKTKGISRVEFKDAGGDLTSIRFEDIKLNGVIGEKVFAE